jgi:hypothetical protein
VETDELIKLMSEDVRPPVNLSRAIQIALIAGTVIAGLAFFSVLGFRPDIWQAAETVRFLFKFVVTISLAAAAVGTIVRLATPGVDLGWWRWSLIVAPLLLALAAAMELFATPSSLWGTKLVGANALHCLTIIPVLASVPLASLLIALRHGAPANPGLAGAVAALASVGIAATLYASNCPDDSPLFVVTWYPLATAIVTAAGYFLGKRVLRW